MLKYIITSVILFMCLPNLYANAELRLVAATGEYRLGDNDTRSDAKRIALLDAKRLALEQAGVYIESITEVKNLDLGRDEIRAYTAGIVEVVEQTTHTTMDGEITVVRVDVKAKIDTDVVARQIQVLRKNEDLKARLLRAEHEAINLRKQLEAKTTELTGATSKDAVQVIARQRQQLINHADVQALLARARTVLPKSRRSTFMLGAIRDEDRQYGRRLIEEALGYEPENLEAQALLGIVEFQEGSLEKATATLRRVARSEPPSSETHLNLGMILHATGYLHSALDEYEIAASLEPGNAEARGTLADGYIAILGSSSRPALTATQIHDMEASAHRELREAIRLAPHNVEYQRRLARLLPLDDALTQLREVVVLDPSDSRSHLALAEALLKMNQDNEALVEFQRAVEIDPGDYYAFEQLGKVFEKHGEMDQAIEAYHRSVQVMPLISNVDSLSEALQKVGKQKEAAQVYRDQLETSRSDSTTGALYRARLQDLEQAHK